MKKTYKIKDLECASCAAKMERSVGKINGVNSVNINFMNGKMEIDGEDEKFDVIVKLADKKCKKIERQVKLEEC